MSDNTKWFISMWAAALVGVFVAVHEYGIAAGCFTFAVLYVGGQRSGSVA